MSFRNVLACVAVLLVAGCSARPTTPAPEAFFTAPIVDVRNSIHDSRAGKSYWVWKQRRNRIQPVMTPSVSEPCWLAKIDYIIDSNGNVFNPEFVELYPDERFKVDALRMLAVLDYVPTKSNPDRVPVQTTITMTMNLEGHRCDRE